MTNNTNMKTQVAEGILTNVKRLKSSTNGNPRYSFSIIDQTFRTGVDCSLGYVVTNFEEKRVSVVHKILRGHNQVESIKPASA
jgi:hypothetical protein